MFIDLDRLDDLAAGCAVLGTGGGGDTGPDVLQARAAIVSAGPVEVVDLDELADDTLVMPIGAWGAPTVGLEKLGSGREGTTLIAAVERAFGRRVGALMAGEIGGAIHLRPERVRQAVDGYEHRADRRVGRIRGGSDDARGHPGSRHRAEEHRGSAGDAYGSAARTASHRSDRARTEETSVRRHASRHATMTMATERAGPSSLWLLRHGQSQGNVIRAAAAADALDLDIPDRDMDVPLSELGLTQARAFGEWLQTAPSEELPDTVIASPYRRAIETAEVVAEIAGLGTVRTDERLRERDLGMMDLLTTRGFAARFPAEAAHRERLGKFYYRPPGGESWTDVALRSRSMRDSLALEHANERVLLVTHEVVIILFRYLIEGLDERAALSLSREGAIANCGLTAYRRGEDGEFEAQALDWTAPLEAAEVRVTGGPDDVVASR